MREVVSYLENDKSGVCGFRLMKPGWKEVVEKIKTSISGNELDAVLLYDVIHDAYFNPRERRSLFKEVNRIIKRKGLLSVFPHHIDSDAIKRIKKEIIDSGFEFSNKVTGIIIHDSTLITDTIYNFNKK